MKQECQVLKLDRYIEEEVTLHVGSVDLVCFSISGSPEPGTVCEADFSLSILDEFIMEELPDNSTDSITRVGNSFAYTIVGKREGQYLVSHGVYFECDELADMIFLEGHYVSVRADRISVDFTDYLRSYYASTIK